jgi:hypothetical protein
MLFLRALLVIARPGIRKNEPYQYQAANFQEWPLLIVDWNLAWIMKR